MRRTVYNVGDALASVAGSLDLTAALGALKGNDLLPPRIEDKLSGQVRAGFLESLADALADGSYRPLPIDRIMVPKRRFSSRPAALMSLADRVVFAALVAKAGDKIERVLDDTDRVFWPRGNPSHGHWKDFENAPLRADPTHVVLADVAGFYESVDHPRLRRVLVETTASGPLADAVAAWLEEVMGASRGLPQGYGASDHLATLYLAEADAAVARAGFLLHRHGDDIRIPVHSYPDALRAVHAVEQALRSCQLLPNSSKLAVEKRGTYAADLNKTDADSALLRELLAGAAKQGLAARAALLVDGEELAEQEREELADDTEEGGVYGDSTPLDPAVLELLQGYMAPTATSEAAASLRNAMRRRPGLDVPREGLLSNVHFHERVASTLPILAASKDPAGLEHCTTLLIHHGEETPIICGYLAAMATTQPNRVWEACRPALVGDHFMLGWQRSWIWNTLAGLQPDALPEGVLDLALTAARSDSGTWLERIEAVRVLARGGQLEQPLLLTLWDRSPAVYQADLMASVAALAGVYPWADRFLSTARQHPVHAVVHHNVKPPALLPAPAVSPTDTPF